MVKKFSTLLMAGALALPLAANAAPTNEELLERIEELEWTIADMEESAETWDLSSRFSWYGDFRTRADYVTADTPEHYTALSIGNGVADVLYAGTAFPTMLADFGMTTGTDLSVMLAGLPATSTDFINAASTDNNTDGQVMSTAQATTLAAIFYNPDVGALLSTMPAGTTIGDIAPFFGSTQQLVSFMKLLSPSARSAVFSSMGYTTQEQQDIENDTIYTNRLRLNMRVKAMENMEFKGRLAMYKVWGMQNNAIDYTFNNGMGGGPFMLSSLTFDGSAARQPADSSLLVDRAFINWNNIAGLPMWFSIGRRPTTDGPPAQLRLGADKKMATPVNYMDYPFDGFSLGYAYLNLFGIQDFPGRVRFCYGRGFESGPNGDNAGLNDVDFGGISWDVYKKGDRFFNFQSFAALNMFNVPDNVEFPNPVEYFLYQNDNDMYNFDPLDPDRNLILDRKNLGNIYHTSTVYMSKVSNLHYFVVGGWSRTDAKGVDELGTSLLGSWWNEPEDKDGYSGYVGVRYDMGDDWRFGAEYNYGSENWIAFTPGHDDLYASKLATRGHVGELYTIWNIPAGEAISKYGKAFMRLGYQYYDYEYTGSGFWLGEPVKIEDLKNDPLNAQFYTPVDEMHQVYLSLEAWF